MGAAKEGKHEREDDEHYPAESINDVVRVLKNNIDYLQVQLREALDHDI